jgi:MOSC domain-containing protein YiiM
MKLISVNVGLPREVAWSGGIVTTGIFKEPVEGPVRVRGLNLAGDGQADLSVHGGTYKAVYAYPAEHYDYWREELSEPGLGWAAFGENLTTEGLDEGAVHIGDRLRIGTAELVVTQPRLPCYKLGIKFGTQEMVKRFLMSRRTGFYFSVAKEGQMESGDRIEIVSAAKGNLTVADITRLYAFEMDDREGLRQAARLEALPESWREYFAEQLRQLDG